MRICVFSMGVLYNEYNQGGSQKILREVCKHLGEHGHQVKILCPRPEDPSIAPCFKINENVNVYPILGFKPNYPCPYGTPPYKLTDVIYSISSFLETSDVFYIHDSELYFKYIFDNIPTVSSFRDFIYPDTLGGGFLFDRDRLIINSEYTYNAVIDTFKLFRPEIENITHLIPNGFNLDFYKPSTSLSAIKKLVNVSDVDIPILFPNRPDEKKGLMIAIDAFHKLIQISGKKSHNLKLLIPKWVEKEEFTNGQIYYDALEKAKRYGISNQIIFHPWVPYNMLPDYYSVGKATLSIGNFVECFGSNSSVESEICGTPAVISKVATQRYTFPDDMVYKVNYGDFDSVAYALLEAINNKRKTPITVIRNYINDKYSFYNMLQEYEKVITTTKKIAPLEFKKIKYLTPESKIKLPIWCHIVDNKIYHDYKYGYFEDEVLVNIFLNGKMQTLNKILDQLKLIDRSSDFRSYNTTEKTSIWFDNSVNNYLGYDRELWDKIEGYIFEGFITPC